MVHKPPIVHNTFPESFGKINPVYLYANFHWKGFTYLYTSCPFEPQHEISFSFADWFLIYLHFGKPLYNSQPTPIQLADFLV